MRENSQYDISIKLCENRNNYRVNVILLTITLTKVILV